MVGRYNGRGRCITSRVDLLQGGPRHTRNAKNLDAALDVLVERDRAYVHDDAARSVEVNPDILGGFHHE